MVERPDKGLCPVTSHPLGLDGGIQLLDQRKCRHAQPHALRLLQGDTHVLDEVVDHEAGRPVAPDHPWGQVVERPASCGAGPYGLHHPLEVETAPGGVDQGLADACHGSGDDDLVAHLGLLAHGHPSAVVDAASHRFEVWPDGFEGGFVGADHEGERRLPCAPVSARYRSVGEGCASGCKPSCNGLHQVGPCRRHVHRDASAPDGRGDPILSQIHLFDVCRVADDREYDVGL